MAKGKQGEAFRSLAGDVLPLPALHWENSHPGKVSDGGLASDRRSGCGRLGGALSGHLGLLGLLEGKLAVGVAEAGVHSPQVVVQPLEWALATGADQAPLSGSLVGLENYGVPGLLYFNGFV